MSSATAISTSTEPYRSAGLCRMLFGAGIIGSAIGWFMIGLCLTKYDLDLGRIADSIQMATNRVTEAEVAAPLRDGTSDLRKSKACMENDVFGSILGAFCLAILGAYMLHSGTKQALAGQPCDAKLSPNEFWHPERTASSENAAQQAACPSQPAAGEAVQAPPPPPPGASTVV